MTNIAQQRARNLGSNYTTFRYAGKSIAYLEMVDDSGQEPVSPGEEIHPLGYSHPTEFVVARAIMAGTLTVSIREMWNAEVWHQLSGLAGANTIIEVFDAVARSGNGINCTKIINPPRGNRYGKTYHNCVISRIQDNENFRIDTLSQAKTVTIKYTHTTPLG